MAKPTGAQEHKLVALKSGHTHLRVEFFDHCMEGKVALVQRIVRKRVDGHGWKSTTQDEMYRIDPDGTCHGV